MFPVDWTYALSGDAAYETNYLRRRRMECVRSVADIPLLQWMSLYNLVHNISSKCRKLIQLSTLTNNYVDHA